jgi:valacyclovir hydrolase
MFIPETESETHHISSIRIISTEFSLFLYLVNLFSSSRNPSKMTPSGSKIEVDGHLVYHERYGTGPKRILVVPGGTGSIHTDLKPLLDVMNKEKYTIIAMDPLGYGKSRPPERDYTIGTAMYKVDADTGVGLMKALGFNSFTWMGWSDGGRTGLVAAISYPSRIDKLIVWGAAAEVSCISEVNSQT